jgi:hypothetical protein
MAAPQQLGGSDLSGLGLFYVPPTEVPNIAAAFIANYTATRVPWAAEVFKRRLAALDPTARNAALVRLQEARNKLVAEMAADQRNAERIGADKGIEAARVLQTIIQAKAKEQETFGGIAEANIQAQTEALKARQISSGAAKRIAADIDRAKSAADYQLSQLGNNPDPAAVAEVMSGYHQTIRNARKAMETEQLDAGEKDAIGDMVTGQTWADPGVAEKAGLIHDAYFQPSERGETRSFGVGRLNVEQAGDDAISFLMRSRGADGGSGGASSVDSSPQPAPSVPRSPPSAAPATPNPSPAPGVTGGQAGGGPRADTTRTAAARPSDVYSRELARIDELMNEVKSGEDGPFGQLGGFTDPLYGLDQRKPRREKAEPVLREKRKGPSLAFAALKPKPKPVEPEADLDTLADEVSPNSYSVSSKSTVAYDGGIGDAEPKPKPKRAPSVPPAPSMWDEAMLLEQFLPDKAQPLPDEERQKLHDRLQQSHAQPLPDEERQKLHDRLQQSHAQPLPDEERQKLHDRLQQSHEMLSEEDLDELEGKAPAKKKR